jgi:hypothetical protein
MAKNYYARWATKIGRATSDDLYQELLALTNNNEEMLGDMAEGALGRHILDERIPEINHGYRVSKEIFNR